MSDVYKESALGLLADADDKRKSIDKAVCIAEALVYAVLHVGDAINEHNGRREVEVERVGGLR